MDTADLHDYFRSQMKDDAEPYLWSDDDVIRYMDDAQKMFCRLTGGLADASNPDITQLAAANADAAGRIATDTRILKVRDAYRTSDGAPIEVINYEDLPTLRQRLDGRTGPTKYLVIGMEPHMAVMYPVSNDATLVIQLLVDRLPLKSIDDTGQKIEIDEQHHAHLFWWMQHLAYLKQDSQTFDKVGSDRAESKFRMYCEDAKAEKDRAKHKTRVVAYGGL